ncbi:MAG: tetratricopeptide repeat protein [Leptotrichiaceae bacterium]|nr:tetratricopeptide repeat protein [Leptotrichiaceae bacterium]
MNKNLFKNILLSIFLVLNSAVLLAVSFGTSEDIKEIELKLKKFGVNKASSEAFLKGMQEKNPANIEKQLLKSVELDRKNYLAYYALGAYYEDEKYGKDKEKAVKYYEKAFGINPDVSFIYEKLGTNYRETGNYTKALEIYEKMIKKFPELPEGYSGAGTVNLYRGNKQKGTEYLSKAVELYNKKGNAERTEGFSMQREIHRAAVPQKENRKNTENLKETDTLLKKSEKDECFHIPLSSENIKEPPCFSLPLPAPISQAKDSAFYSEGTAPSRTEYSNSSIGKKEDERKKEKQKIKTEIASIFIYFEKKEYSKGFSMFFENYSDIVDILDDKIVEETVEIIKKYNEKIKSTDRKLYEENMKKFKELDIL